MHRGSPQRASLPATQPVTQPAAAPRAAPAVPSRAAPMSTVAPPPVRAPRAAPAQPAPDAIPGLDGPTITAVLSEFVSTDYCRTLCNHCNCPPTDYGQIWGVFESVRLDGVKLVVQLKPAFNAKSEVLLSKLAKHLRARLPQLKQLNEDSRQRGFSTRML